MCTFAADVKLCLSLSAQRSLGTTAAQRLLLYSQREQEVSGTILWAPQSVSEELRYARHLNLHGYRQGCGEQTDGRQLRGDS